MDKEYLINKYGETMKDMILDENGYEKVEVFIIKNNNKYRAVINNIKKASEILEEEKIGIDTEWYNIDMKKFELRGIVKSENDISLIIRNGAIKQVYINNIAKAQEEFDKDVCSESDSGIYIVNELINIKDENY